MRDRRSDFDVTNTVQVSSPTAVRDAAVELFAQVYPGERLTLLRKAFNDFADLFRGELEGFHGCETVYHDMQHTLDMSLATARLIVGYEKTVPDDQRLGLERATVGQIVALFHDAGYIRREEEQDLVTGSELTRHHVSRSAEFLKEYLPKAGLGHTAEVAATIVHFTGMERSPEDIEVDDPLYKKIGHLVGTADLIAQMADRCYLEKCRDRLFPEFVLGGIAMAEEEDTGKLRVLYESGEDLLKKTPEFFKMTSRDRLDGSFNKAYQYFEAVFDGQNPYIDSVEKNLAFLDEIIRNNNWPMLRRSPPCFTWKSDDLDDTQRMAALKIRALKS